MTDTIALSQKLIACPSVTPEDAGAQAVLKSVLEPAGFTCHDVPFGEGGDGDERIENLFARFGDSGKHLCYAGHTDVVPPGPKEAWRFDPFSAHIEDGVLYGRGASDMKSSVAAFSCAAIDFVKAYPDFGGSISMLITGDEEADAINGTVKVLEWMKDCNHIPDVALVGEPTNPDHHGQEVKIGRRGSLNGYITVTGSQGHVAYQHLADNPVPDLMALCHILSHYEFDTGTEYFAGTNLEFTKLNVDTDAMNVIPGQAMAAFNIRYNDNWTKASLIEKIESLLNGAGLAYDSHYEGNAESFITQPGPWSEIVLDAVHDISGHKPQLTTSGGTSDARFVVKYCPVVEYGVVNNSIHQINENARVSDLETLRDIYFEIIKRYFNV